MEQFFRKQARRSWARSLGLAAITGLRTSLGPAFAVRGLGRRTGLRRIGYALVMAELVADKLPQTPARTRPLGLTARAASGGLVAGLTYPGRGAGAGTAAVILGATAAVAAAFVGIRLRRGLTGLLGGGPFAGAVAGLLEDTGAVALGLAIESRCER